MKDTETFILNIKAHTSVSGKYTVNINIPNAKHYKKFRMFVKDFIIIDSQPTPTEIQTDIYTLNSDTLLFDNNYANFILKDQVVLGSRFLAVVCTKAPFVQSQNEAYFSIPHINGTHTFWLEDFLTSNMIVGVDCFFSLVVQGYN